MVFKRFNTEEAPIEVFSVKNQTNCNKVNQRKQTNK